MFILRLYDRKGVELHLGDTVKVSDGKGFDFFAEVKYLKDEGAITPFHTFCFHSVEKIDKLPKNAKKSTETRYNIWYLSGDPENDSNAKDFEGYLSDWQDCERQIDSQMWRIEKQEVQKSTLF